MADPLAQIVGLLQPRAQFAKLVHGATPWRGARSVAGHPFYCLVLEGGCRLSMEGREAIELVPGDFALVPSTYGVSVSSLQAPADGVETAAPVSLGNGEFRIGPAGGTVEVQLFVGHCSFDAPDAALLVSLLPELLHVRGEARLGTVVQLIRDESRAQRDGREIVLTRLLELLFIEALRSSAGSNASPGLLRGLADTRMALAIRSLHAQPAHPWTVAELAKQSALSRTTFFVRFSQTVGITPMAYLLAWRMALAKDLLRREGGRLLDEVARRVGYGSASAFSVAFTRHVGHSPTQFVRSWQARDPSRFGLQDLKVDGASAAQERASA